MLESRGTEILGERECLRLLATAPVGRVVFTDRALPAVAPVNFVLHKGKVVFRTDPCGQLAAGVRNAVVAFQVDEFDACAHSGWSVTVIGYARVVREDAELSSLGLCASVGGPHGRFVVIVPEILTGRRIPERWVREEVG
ncbi:pyridoxamine 5'-phosphate oxidase family protein [Allokutzneria oryzae]|uniref:Pyridoxamine 5'-phosphate oxidase family protein n=1 Tax=Allokutzneria oryzae TaxID=1378989 RepID=A0ABV6A5W3_9PSEU